ncbi:MAG TPA: hypothetical protein VND23_09950 [Acidimicrobiales bacterium]|nr:hypothetical protein [Acidimicrobiales bacterium]HZV26220.1 hypothetical protein [Acidothermaceae bacterium]
MTGAVLIGADPSAAAPSNATSRAVVTVTVSYAARAGGSYPFDVVMVRLRAVEHGRPAVSGRFTVTTNGPVQSANGGAQLPSPPCRIAIVRSHVAWCAFNYAAAGRFLIRATFRAPHWTGSAVRVVLVHARPSPAVAPASIALSVFNPDAGQALPTTFEATVNDPSTAGAAGSVTFSVEPGGETCADVPLYLGAATCAVYFATAASVTVTAIYTGSDGAVAQTRESVQISSVP